MGSMNMVVASIVGVVLVVVTFILHPILVGQVDGLFGYFVDSAVDSNRQHFTKVYLGVSGDAVPGFMEYNTGTRTFGGPGANLSGTGVTITLPAISTTAAAVESGATIYNERGKAVGTTSAVGASNAIAAASYTLNPGIKWQAAPEMLTRFGSINTLLLSLTPVITVAAFLGMSAMTLWRYGTGGTTELSGQIMTVVMTLVFVIVVLALGPTVLDAALVANSASTSGQYGVTAMFNNIVELLFAVIPLVYVAGILGVTALTGLQTVKGGKKGAMNGGGGGLVQV